MWTEDHRRAADRRGLRYPSDLTDTEWELVKPFIRPAKRGGRPRSVDIREVLLERDLLRALDLVPVERHPVRSPAAQHRLGLSRSLEVDGTIARIHEVLGRKRYVSVETQGLLLTSTSSYRLMAARDAKPRPPK